MEKWGTNADTNLDVVLLQVMGQYPFGVDLFATALASLRIRQGRDAVHQNLTKTNRTEDVQQLTNIFLCVAFHKQLTKV